MYTIHVTNGGPTFPPRRAASAILYARYLARTYYRTVVVRGVNGRVVYTATGRVGELVVRVEVGETEAGEKTDPQWKIPATTARRFTGSTSGDILRMNV